MTHPGDSPVDATSGARREARARPRLALWVFLLLTCSFLLATSRDFPEADARVVYDTTRALVDRGELSLHAQALTRLLALRDGRLYAVFPLGNVVAQVPGYLLFRAVEPLHLTGSGALQIFTIHLAPAVLVAAACVVFLGLARRWGAGPRLATALTLVLGFSTIAFVYARSPFSEALQMFALTWSLDRAFRAGDDPGPRSGSLLGVAAGILFNSKLVYAVVLPILLAAPALGLRRTGRSAWAAGAAFVASFGAFFAVAVLHNVVKTGNPLDSGYREAEGLFSGDLLPALYGYTLSTGKSVFLYSPPLVLAVLGFREALQRRRLEAWTVIAVVIALAIASGEWRHWDGDWSWGPRYAVAVTPALMLLAVPRLSARGGGDRVPTEVWLFAIAGAAVQILGASLNWDHFISIIIDVKDRTGAAGWFRDALSHSHYIPQFSPLRGHLWLLEHLARGDPDLDADAPWKLLVPQPVDLSAHWATLRIDWWALDLAGTPVGSRLLVVLLFGAGLAGVSVRRALRSGAA